MCLILKPCGFMKNLFCIHEVTLDLFLKIEKKEASQGMKIVMFSDENFEIFIATPRATFFLFKGHILIYSHKK